MKNKFLIFTLIVVLVFGSALAVFATSPNSDVITDEDEAVLVDVNISPEEAKEFAAKVNPDATFVSIELGDENGTIIYEVVFKSDSNEFEVKVNANELNYLPEDNNHEDADDLDDEDDDQVEHEFEGEEEHED